MLTFRLAEEREEVITVAQASNGGLILPFLCHLLFICLKDDDLMKTKPMNFLFSLWFHFCVGLTVFLASYSILAVLDESMNVITRLGLASGFFGLDILLLGFLVRK